MTETVSEFIVHNEEPGGFSWDIEGLMIGPLSFGHTRHGGVDISMVRAPDRIARDGIDAIRLMQCLDGGSWWTTDAGAFGQRVGDIVVSDFSRPDHVQMRGQTARVLIVPRSSLGVPEAALDHLHGLVLRPGGATHGLLAAHLEALWDRRETLILDEVDPVSQATLGLITALLIRPARSRWTTGLRTEASAARIMRFIRDNLGDCELGPAMLCRRFGVSRANLYRIFEPFGGVANYVRNQRLKRAVHRLGASGPSPPIGRLAGELGFSNVDVFRSAFRRKHGFGPGEARDRGLTGVAAFTGPDPDRAHMTIPGWIRELNGP